jgi:hypothetical protein
LSDSSYLLPIADREPLAWIVREQRMAFSAHRKRDSDALSLNDRLFLYTTRACFRNPGRDRGRVIGVARVAREPYHLTRAVHFGSRIYPIGIGLVIDALAPLGRGIELAPLVPSLESFPDPRSWSARMRRPLVPLAEADAKRLSALLKKVEVPYAQAADSYAL